MSTHDRYLSDNLFELGFASLERGDYREGLDTIRTAAGADQFEWDPDKHYDPAVGIEHLSDIKRAADGFLDENGRYSPAGNPKPHASALVFMGLMRSTEGSSSDAPERVPTIARRDSSTISATRSPYIGVQKRWDIRWRSGASKH